MARTLLAERRETSGERPVNAAKPEGSRSRPAAIETQSKVSAIRLTHAGLLTGKTHRDALTNRFPWIGVSYWLSIRFGFWMPRVVDFGIHVDGLRRLLARYR
jgi:hypothetical protein